MSKYTIELWELLEDGYDIFHNIEYDFYLEVHKDEFEKKFMDKYMFYEIGFSTVFKFQHYLKEKLNRIMPYYKQLYQTELACKDINFMLNKDLIEEFTRELDTQSETNRESTGSVNTVSDTVSVSDENTKESNIDNGLAKVGLGDNYLTGLNNTSINTSDEMNSNENTTSSSNDTEETSQVEKTRLVSQGNIGVTSSGHLLKDWREVLINIDEMIINECKDLFMGVL